MQGQVLHAREMFIRAGLHFVKIIGGRYEKGLTFKTISVFLCEQTVLTSVVRCIIAGVYLWPTPGFGVSGDAPCVWGCSPMAPPICGVPTLPGSRDLRE